MFMGFVVFSDLMVIAMQILGWDLVRDGLVLVARHQTMLALTTSLVTCNA